MNVSTRQLRAFLLVARLRNFTRAAEALHMTQAGLSIMIRELETQLDHRLFDRTTRGVSLTPAGEKLLPVAADAVERLDSVADKIVGLSKEARLSLRIAATPLVSSNLLPTVCAQFRQRHPEVKLGLVDTDLAQVAALVQQGEADLGLGFFFQPAKGIERKLLYSFPLMRVSPVREGESPGLRAGRLARVPWSALKGDELIGLPVDNPVQRLVEKALSAIGRDNEEKPIFNRFETLIAMVEAGMGSAVIPSYALAACRRHRVNTELLSQPEVVAGFYRITKRGAAPAHHVAEFTDMMVEGLPAMMGEKKPPAGGFPG